MTLKDINNSMMMNGGNTPEQKADKAWFDYCFEFKDGPYTAILEYKKALRRAIEKEAEISPWIHKDNLLPLLDTVSPE
jgi:hypothetical protein